ncbi:MAG: hypothetical protein AAGA56_04255 [Myxococcota bacterium]
MTRHRLREALEAVAAVLPTLGAPAMLIGGFAAIARGVPRTTRDIDVTIAGGAVAPEVLLRRFEAGGFDARIEGALAFAARSQVLLLRHRSTGVEVDASLAWLSFELEALANATSVVLAGAELPVARAEDLVIYKALAWRPRDQDDVEALLVVEGRAMNLDRIRHVVAELSDALDDPDRRDELEAMIARVL